MEVVSIDIVTYALCKKMASGAASGVANMKIEGTDLIITTNDGQTLTMSFPSPEDGASIVDVSIDEDGSLICTLSDGNIIDAGYVPSVPGEPGHTPVKGEDYFTDAEIKAIEDDIYGRLDDAFTLEII